MCESGSQAGDCKQHRTAHEIHDITTMYGVRTLTGPDQHSQILHKVMKIDKNAAT